MNILPARRGAVSLLVLALAGASANGNAPIDPPFSLTPPLAPTGSPPLFMDSVPMVNPADRAARESASSRPVASQRVPNWQLPAVTVVGQSESGLKSDELVGPYSQPRWTVDRRFPGTRVYVIPEGTVEFEYWNRIDVPRKGGSRVQNMFELEFGLPARFQLDLYAIQRTQDDETAVDTQVELRWAFADWGKIWGNPTMYVEYASKEDDPDKIEVKLLLGDQFGKGWHWGQNFLWEAETGGEREYEYGWTGGLSKSVIDTVLDVGAELQVSFYDLQGDRGSYTHEVFFGPSVQYRPNSRVHLNLAPLIGIGHESPDAKVLFNFGYEF